MNRVDQEFAEFKQQQRDVTPPAPTPALILTDYGSSEQFTLEHGRDLRYCPPLDEWSVYDGRRWTPDTTMEVERRAAMTVRRFYVRAANEPDSSDRAAIVAFAKLSEKRERLAAIPALARQQLAVSPDQFDRDTMKLNVENGTVNLRDGTLLHHDRADMLTCLAPVVYDATAKCPLWLAFLDRIMAENGSLVGYLQRLCGYFITGEIDDQIFPILHGEGANGKSVFIDTITGIMGEYARIAPDSLLTASAHDSHPTEVAMLKGARLVVGSETEEGRRLKVQQVKRMTGDTTLVARRMRQDFFQFTRTHKTVLITNNRPVVSEAKNAIWRRIRLIPFSVRIPPAEQDQQLLHKLRREWSGILNWMIAGCLEWQRIGLADPMEVGIATDDYRAEQDRIAAFVDDCLYPINANNWTSRKAIREVYVEWARRTGERNPLDPAGLYERLCDLDGVAEKFGTENGKKTRGFAGIAILPGGNE